MAIQGNNLARLSLAGYVNGDGGEQRSTSLEEAMDEVGAWFTSLLFCQKERLLDDVCPEQGELG